MWKRLLAVLLLLAPLGCEKPTEPPSQKSFLKTADIGGVGDSIRANDPLRLVPVVQFDSGVDSNRVKYTWSLSDSAGVPVALDSAVSRLLDWVPEKPGRYSARLTIEYEGQTATVFIVLVVLQGDSRAEKLEWFRKGVLGEWEGSTESEWRPSIPVTFAFRADGTYSAHAVDTTDGPAMYYGSDEDSGEKTWALNDVQAGGDAVGEIGIFFWAGDVARGDLRHVKLSEDRNQLSFEFWHFGETGPFKFSLTRKAVPGGNP